MSTDPSRGATAPSAVATLLLRVRHRGGGEEYQEGAVARVSSRDAEPVSVTVPVGSGKTARSVGVPAGFVHVALRLPNGRRMQKSVKLEPGEKREITFEQDGVPDVRFGPRALASVRGTFSGSALQNLEGLESLGHEPNDLRAQLRSISRLALDQESNALPAEAVLVTFRPDRDYTVAADAAGSVIGAHAVRIGLPGASSGQLGAIVVRARATDQVLVQVLPRFQDRLDLLVASADGSAPAALASEVIVRSSALLPMLGFLANDDLISVQAALKSLERDAMEFLFGKYQNPAQAIVGAYALARTAEGGASPQWLEILYRDFPMFSDGALLFATDLMRRTPGAANEWYGQVRQALLDAAKRPVPLLTEGIRRMVEGLDSLASSKRCAGDVAVIEAQRRARWLHTRARRKSLFTSFWLDESEIAEVLLPWPPKGPA